MSLLQQILAAYVAVSLTVGLLFGAVLGRLIRRGDRRRHHEVALLARAVQAVGSTSVWADLTEGRHDARHAMLARPASPGAHHLPVGPGRLRRYRRLRQDGPRNDGGNRHSIQRGLGRAAIRRRGPGWGLATCEGGLPGRGGSWPVEPQLRAAGSAAVTGRGGLRGRTPIRPTRPGHLRITPSDSPTDDEGHHDGSGQPECHTYQDPYENTHGSRTLHPRRLALGQA